MGEKKVFETDRAPLLKGPYSQAIIHNGLIYISGQGAIDPDTKRVVPGTIQEETRMTMGNIRNILDEAGSSLSNILKVTVYLLNMKEYAQFNEVYAQYFQADLPARSCIQAAKLPFGLKLEIDAIACI